MHQVKIGIIGGSGLYDMNELTDRREIAVETPFGAPSDRFIVGKLGGKDVAFLARHGRGHRILPSEINFRANIYAMKMLGVERIFSASAVGSLRADLAPLDILLPDQFIDRTRGRISTFLATASLPMWHLQILSAPTSWRKFTVQRPRQASMRSEGALTFAWKARRFPLGRSRSFTAAGAWT